jgi:hypothetical protein
VFPDFVRRLVLETLPSVYDWTFSQVDAATFVLALPQPLPDPESIEAFRVGWTELCRRRGAHSGLVHLADWRPPQPGAKRRRVVGLPSA